MLMVVGDAVDEFFGETGLTGLVKSDLSSKAAVGDPGVPESHELLYVEIDGAVGPESCIHLIESSPYSRAVGHDGSA